MTPAVVVAIGIGVPALAWTLWPLRRRATTGARWLALPTDDREALFERKRAAFVALRELDFEHDSGHVSDVDYADLRVRYEAEAAAALTALDRLGLTAPPPRPAARVRAAPRGWRHPLATAVGALALVVFGIAIGAGISRYVAPESSTGMPASGARPLAEPLEKPSMAMAPDGVTGARAPRQVPPEVLRGMLAAARTSLFEGRYSEAIAAYQAVLKRDPRNVDAMTHLGLIVAIGGHADAALETFDKVLALNPDYGPALLYRGQVLLDSRQDTAGAIASWEKFVAVTPPGADRERVKKMIADARAAVSGRR